MGGEISEPIKKDSDPNWAIVRVDSMDSFEPIIFLPAVSGTHQFEWIDVEFTHFQVVNDRKVVRRG